MRHPQRDHRPECGARTLPGLAAESDHRVPLTDEGGGTQRGGLVLDPQTCAWRHRRFRPQLSASAAGFPHAPHSVQVWSGSPGQGRGSLASNIRGGGNPQLGQSRALSHFWAQVCSAPCLCASPRHDEELPKHREIKVVKYHHSPNRCHLILRMGSPLDMAVPRFNIQDGQSRCPSFA